MTRSESHENVIGGARAYHHGGLRAVLVAAGRALLEEEGQSALSLRAAARRAGVSHAAPRHHFLSLAHFVADCAADGFAEFDAGLRAAGTAADPVEALAAMGRAYVRFALGRPAMFLLMWEGTSVMTPALAGARAGAKATLHGAVRSAVPSSSEERITDLASSAWALAHGYAGLALGGQIGPAEGAPDRAARAIRALAASWGPD